MRNWKLQQNLSQRVDIQIEEQIYFNKWLFMRLKLNICCVHLFMLAWIPKNELAWVYIIWTKKLAIMQLKN